MLWLANENFPLDAITLLRQRGYDVAWCRTESPGAPDAAVLARAVRERRVLLTFDKDFGELVFHAGHDASCGVVLFRITRPSSGAIALTIAEMLESRTDWPGHFSTVDDKGVRMTPVPGDKP